MFNVLCVIQRITSGFPPQVKKEDSDIYAGLKIQCTILRKKIGSKEEHAMPAKSLMFILYASCPASVSTRGASPNICFSNRQ